MIYRLTRSIKIPTEAWGEKMIARSGLTEGTARKKPCGHHIISDERS